MLSTNAQSKRSGIYFGDAPVRQRRKETTGETATLNELQELNGSNSDFVVAQLAIKATVDEAMKTLNKHLFDELTKATTELDRRRANRRF